MQLVERQAGRLCRELQGRETENKLWGTQLGQPSQALRGSGESPLKRLSLAPVSIKDDTLSTTLKDTKEGSMFVRVSVFSPCLLKLCVGWLPNAVLHTQNTAVFVKPGLGKPVIKTLEGRSENPRNSPQ